MKSSDTVLVDLQSEVAATHSLLASLTLDQWSLVTPAPGWTVADQVIHLGLFDRRAMWSMTDPDVFHADRDKMAKAGGVEGIHAAERERDVSELFEWWQEGAAALVDAASQIDLSQRCAWYGPSMSGTSMLTARLMENWAHAHDIADAVLVPVVASMRLKHVAHIGVRAMPFAFAANKRPMPGGDVYVELTAPDNSVWAWGDPNAESSVRGSALGFCQAVTQRRHVADCALTTAGEPATQWMSIAQAFAGPPGVGRQPGQFS
jgi:uncharacterized protein (TIGR03084 family)